MKKNPKKFLYFLVCIILTFSFFIGCIESNNDDDFLLLNWETRSSDNSSTSLVFNFLTNISDGFFYLYNQDDFLIEKKPFSYNDNNVSFTISYYKTITPKLGPYKIVVNMNSSDDEINVLKIDNIILKEANLSITACEPIWIFEEGHGTYNLESINISIYNNGDVYGFIYEGRIIVDNSSIFLAPDYHWHDLDLWLKPKDGMFIVLPVKVPRLNIGSHFIKVYMQDELINTVAYYENIIYTPKI